MFDFDKHRDSTAVITDDGVRMTYGDLGEEVKKWKQGIGMWKVKPLVFCLCTNSLPSLLGYVSCLEEGIPCVLLDARKDLETIQSLVEVYCPEYIWMPSDEKIGTGFRREGTVTYQFRGYSLLRTHCEASNHAPLHPDLALCLTTSGSTGSPKLVRLTERNLLSNAESIASYLGIDEKERPVTMLPMYYSYGLSVINSHLIRGATIMLTDKSYAQREFWNFVREEGVTSMSGVPYTWEMLRRLRFMRMDLPSVKTMTQAGGKLNAEIAKEYINWAKEQGKRFFVMYGQTEATARMSYLPWEQALDKYSSIGVAVPGGRFRLEEDGELVYEGENVCMGYAECRDDLSKGDENCGVLHTGDVARVDEDGLYYIVGRKKRFVKVWGNRCNLDAIEQLIKPITTSCACVGVDDKITVFVTQSGLDKEIKETLTKKTGLNSIAFDIKEIESIPVKDNGKIDYPILQQWI